MQVEWLTMDTILALQSLITQRDGMVAENKQREFAGAAMAYVEDNFQALVVQFESLRERLRRENV